MSADIRIAPLAARPPALRSGREELDRWLPDHALPATRAGSARVYLAHRGEVVVGYFALAAGSVDPVRAGTCTRTGMPRHPIPVVLLARLAVSQDAAGQGIGRELVRQAVLITVRVAGLVAVRALVVDALDPSTAHFYERVGFTPNAANGLRLEVLVKDLDAVAADEPAR